MTFPLRDKCEEKAERMNIPHFTLLACDKFSLLLVDKWIHLAEEFNVPAAKINEALELRRAMVKFQNDNPELCKIPD